MRVFFVPLPVCVPLPGLFIDCALFPLEIVH